MKGNEQAETLRDLLDYALIACPVEGGVPSEHDITEERVEELRDRAAGIIGGEGTQEEREILVDILNFSLEAYPGIPSTHEITDEKVEEIISLLKRET
ncbi:MAG: hypothetical protein ACE5LQ_00390 [Candidatus Bipolaricaulia bacterium]